MTDNITGKVIPIYDVKAHYSVVVQNQTFLTLALYVLRI